MNLKTEDFFTHLWHLTCNLIWQFVTFYSKEDFKKNFKDSPHIFLLFANDKRMIFLIVCRNAYDNFQLQWKILFWMALWKMERIFCHSHFTWNQIRNKWRLLKGNYTNAHLYVNMSWFFFLFFFKTLNMLKLISRKIWSPKSFLNFHTVWR